MAKHDIAKRRALLAELIDELPRPWVIAVVRRTQEFEAERALARLAIVHYCPARIVESRGGVRRTMRRQLRPAFPRYMFICLHNAQFILLDKVDAVQGILCMQGIPVRMTLKVLREVAKRELNGEFDSMIPTSHGFHVNDRVSVTWETLTMEGIVARLIGQKKAVVDLETRRVTVAVAQLARI